MAFRLNLWPTEGPFDYYQVTNNFSKLHIALCLHTDCELKFASVLLKHQAMELLGYIERVWLAVEETAKGSFKVVVPFCICNSRKCECILFAFVPPPG